MQISSFVDISVVAGPEPFPVEGLRGLFGIIVISPHDVPGIYIYLSDAVSIRHVYLYPYIRIAVRAPDAVIAVVDAAVCLGYRRAAFSRRVIDHEVEAQVQYALCQIRRARSSARVYVPHVFSQQ